MQIINNINLNKYNPYIKVAAISSIVIALLAVIGWFTHIESLKSLIVGLPTMKFNTALCFILLGSSLLLLLENKKEFRYAQLCILTVVLIFGTMSFMQDAFHFNSGIDQWLMKDTVAASSGEKFPGRMATSTAFCFMLVSLAFIAFVTGKKNVLYVAQFMLHLVTLMGFIATLGYLYKVPSFYQLAFLSAMAINTAIIFILISVSASLLNSSIGITGLFTGKRIGSVVARKIFPIIAFMIIVLGLIRLELSWRKLITEDFGTALFATSFLLVSLVIIAISAKYLNKADEERNKAEEALKIINKHLKEIVVVRTQHIQEISERLKLAAKGSKIGIWDWDIITDTLTWDDRMYELYGITSLTFGGAYQAWEKGLHPDDKEAGRKAIEDAIAGKQEFDIEFRVLWPDESVHYIKGIALVQRDDSGKAIRMVGTNWDITESILLQKKLEQARIQNEKIVLKTAFISQEKERTHIGHELHENVNQLLASANIYIGLAVKDSSQKTAGLLLESRQMIMNAIEEIHKLAHNIKHSHIEEIGLYEAIKDIIKKINVTKLVKVEFKPTLNPSGIPPEIALTVYRILQEQLNNILKYAEAKNVTIQIDPSGNDLVLVITDDGKGADLVDFKKGMGLLNMKNRAKAYHGKASFETSPGKGFKLTVVLPFQNIHSA